jgi:alkylated DNA repair dioxygenase AlkB
MGMASACRSPKGTTVHDISQLPGARIQITENFIAAVAAEKLMAELIDCVDWRRDTIKLFGKAHPIPRLHQWFGDPGTTYRWSGISMQPQPWLPCLTDLRARLEATTGHGFNSALANYYRDGNDSMGWHSDNEPELGPQPTIASISLGAERELLLRQRQRTKGTSSKPIKLSHGSLMLMSGDTQNNWEHALPKRSKLNTPRINLTFRLTQIC